MIRVQTKNYVFYQKCDNTRNIIKMLQFLGCISYEQWEVWGSVVVKALRY